MATPPRLQSIQVSPESAYLTLEVGGSDLRIATAPTGRWSFRALTIESLLVLEETDLGRSILARLALTLTPESVLLDISKQPSDHQVSLLRAFLMAPSTVPTSGWICDPWNEFP